MSYSPEKTIILFENSDKNIFICIPTGELPVEDVALRDLPAGTPYWIKQFESVEEKESKISEISQFFFAYELDKDELGEPHGVALGYDEWYQRNRSN